MKQKIFARAFKLSAMMTALVAANSAFAAHDPVIMIPGMGGTVSNMATMKSNLQSNGWDADRLFTWTDSSQMKQDMAVAAQEISAKVDQVLAQTGASKVVLTTWSASTIAARYYIKNLGGSTKVSQYIAFAGPHHGIANWTLCQTTPSCAQWGPSNSPFLTALNANTEVPGAPAVKYLTLRSVNDTNAAPVDTAMLAGAENYLMSGTGAPTHFTIITDATALAKMRSFITANESATPTPTPPPTPTPTPPPTPTPSPPGNCYKSSNYSHVSAGRAHATWTGYALANGSNQNMGVNNLFYTTRLRQTGANFYVIDSTCP